MHMNSMCMQKLILMLKMNENAWMYVMQMSAMNDITIKLMHCINEELKDAMHKHVTYTSIPHTRARIIILMYTQKK